MLPYNGERGASVADLLFAYGTLQVPRVFEVVTGVTRAGREARLPGFRCRRLVSRSFPGVVADDGHSTAGTLYQGVDAEMLRRLDAFEDDFYARVVVRVLCGDEALEAWVYVVQDSHRELLSEEVWDLETFVREDLEGFLSDRGTWDRTGRP